MGILLEIFDGLAMFVSTLWALQERRFNAIFDSVSSAARSAVMTIVLCSIRRRRRWSDFLI
uniref:Uncharacterized protein n=1 Tax=Nelumbo nucifera TaxID=4432 RepID=A0A822ZIJ0_NELNU|nr:TPA_asm: hypothetical protein HUJ06_015831 [Nelumbo nucifera]